jgi:uracil-DNA glycosylase family 4
MDALTMLRLQVEWGADEALDPDPVVRLRPVERRADTAPAPIRETIRPRAVAGSPIGGTPIAGSPIGGTPAERALAAAGAAGTVAALRAAIAAFDGCALKDTASNLVFAAGNIDAGLLIVGEPPGSEEDRSGAPFAGREGALLDAMLASIGLTRTALLLTPLIPWRPPGGRPPNAGELALCLPFLHRLVALTMPRSLILMGALATRALLPARRRGVGWVECAIPGVAGAIPALTTPGLSAMLKTPALRRDAWTALRLLRRKLDAEEAK